MSLGPLDFNGGQFLELYSLLLAASVFAGLVIPRLLVPQGRPNLLSDPDQIAFLAGRARRFQEAVTARLLATRALVIIDRRSFRAVDRDKAVSPAEKSIVRLPSPIHWRQIKLALEPHIRPLERRLIAAGLLMDEKEWARIRGLAVLPYVLLILLGSAKWIVGEARDRPVLYLTLMLVLTLALAILRWATISRGTRAAPTEIAAARRRSTRLQLAPTGPEIGMAVALFGTDVLAGSAWANFHKLPKSGQGGGGCGGACVTGAGGSCGGGDGGSGCGGGGCGGCGG